MIATRTPFRITLGGGGTDLPSFYEKHGGFVLAMGLDKYMYVVLNTPLADRLVRLHYTKSEIVANAGMLKHELAREALIKHGVHDAIEIASVADLPAGSGLGSSSCYLIGLLNALRAYRRKPISLQELAEEACHIELDILKKAIGKQDQYMAAYGGLTSLTIAPDGTVDVAQLEIEAAQLATFVANTHFYYTATTRNAVEILKEQDDAMKVDKSEGGPHIGSEVEASLLEIKDIGYRIQKAVLATDFDEFGRLMDLHWICKKKLSSKITVPQMEDIYEHVKKEYGVLGGKVAGAGGGGFLMLYCPNNHKELTEFMKKQGMSRLHYQIEFEGSKIIANAHNAQMMNWQES
jgi:D-glycero-alpha-D-manno-heptose-7-phosphate kinase